MNQLALKKSKSIKKRYQIDSFPIPRWQIEQIIIDYGYDIVISCAIRTSYILGRTVYIPITSDAYSRIYLSHELGHILCHSFNKYSCANTNLSKCEIQADAFSVYFLIPIRRFKIDSKIYNSYELSELYGVPVEFIDSCVKKYLTN